MKKIKLDAAQFKLHNNGNVELVRLRPDKQLFMALISMIFLVPLLAGLNILFPGNKILVALLLFVSFPHFVIFAYVGYLLLQEGYRDPVRYPDTLVNKDDQCIYIGDKLKFKREDCSHISIREERYDSHRKQTNLAQLSFEKNRSITAEPFGDYKKSPFGSQKHTQIDFLIELILKDKRQIALTHCTGQKNINSVAVYVAQAIATALDIPLK